MTSIPERSAGGRRGLVTLLPLALAMVIWVRPAAAQADFPNIPVWSYPGAWHAGAGQDTITPRSRTTTVRWLRDPVAEARPDFGGYRIYRATNVAGVCDTASMVLMRRFSRQIGDTLITWHFPRIFASTPESQRIATFIDPDSAGRFVKVRRPPNDPCRPRCYDSVMVLVPPPGPHDGFRTWYSITYEALNTSFNDYLDMFVPGAIESRSDFDTGSHPVGLATGDLNGDGLADLATANETAGSVSIRFGRDAARCAIADFGPRRELLTGAGPRSLAIGDLNQDGRNDLVVARPSNHTISIFLGTGGGALVPAPEIALNGAPIDIVLNDIDSNLRLDLVVANGSATSVFVLLGNGDGTFGPASEITTSIRPSALTLGDMNDDRQLDLAVASALDGAVAWRLGIGDGTFGVERTSPTGLGARAVVITDVGSDGQPELVVANGVANTVTLMPGLGDGTFGPAASFPAGVAPASIGVIDLDGDARVDIAVADEGGGALSFLHNSTVLDTLTTQVHRDITCSRPGSVCTVDSVTGIVQGTLDFSTSTTMPLAGHPIAVVTGNFDREGLFDLAVADSSASVVNVIFGATNLNHKAANVSNDIPFPTADLNSDPDDRYFAHPVEPTGGQTLNLARVAVVPNPYRAVEAWNPAGGHEVHFINLPGEARIRIFTVAGDLVREIHHSVLGSTLDPDHPWDQLRDFESWDLKNGSGRDVSSGIYLYRVEAGAFTHQSRFIIIR